MYVLGWCKLKDLYIASSFLAFYEPFIFARQQLKVSDNIHAVSTNKIADILHFKDNKINSNSSKNNSC